MELKAINTHLKRHCDFVNCLLRLCYTKKHSVTGVEEGRRGTAPDRQLALVINIPIYELEDSLGVATLAVSAKQHVSQPHQALPQSLISNR